MKIPPVYTGCMEFVLVHRTPGSWRRFAVDDDGLVVRTGSEQNSKLWVRPTDLPHRTVVPGKRLELVVVAVPDNFEDIDLAVT